MNDFKNLLGILTALLVLASCAEDDTDEQPLVLDAGILSGGPFEFVIDGVPDMVDGIALDDTALNGDNQTYVITDAADNILGLPPNLDAVEGVDFDAAGAGVCFIWHLTYQDGLSGLEPGGNVSDFSGEYDLSNSIRVNRSGLNAGVLAGGPYLFTIDGVSDMVTGISLDDSELNGSRQTFVITDDANNILGLPPTVSDLEGVDFDGAGPGVCLIWHLTYEEGLLGLEPGSNVSDFVGQFALSNSISVSREALNAGSISGGPFEFTIDGIPDMVSGISLDSSELNGNLQTYVITDDANNILGLPTTLNDLEAVNFDGAGPGVCLIWHLTYVEGLSGLSAGYNISDLDGYYALSNSIGVTRNALNAGILSGGPFEFTIDGMPDMVSGISLDDSTLNGSRQVYVITDDANNILGLPPTLTDLQAVDFDGAGAGVCLIWHLTYEDGLNGLSPGNNISDLDGYYALSNSISVTRSW